MIALFNQLCRSVSQWAGSPGAFLIALALVLVWVITGPVFNYSDTWQLVINTGTTIVTFLIVFLIQNTQNRDAKAIHLKLDELLCAVDKARIELVDAEDLRDEELERHQREFSERKEQAVGERENAEGAAGHAAPSAPLNGKLAG